MRGVICCQGERLDFMNCCDSFGNCKQGFNCPAREMPFTFCHNDKSPQAEVTSDLFYFVGFALILTVICLIAGISWGLFERYYPSTACLVTQLFSINCR
jgi:hypothetical protein